MSKTANTRAAAENGNLLDDGLNSDFSCRASLARRAVISLALRGGEGEGSVRNYFKFPHLSPLPDGEEKTIARRGHAVDPWNREHELRCHPEQRDRDPAQR